jgi:hypothetical protein
MLLLAAIGAVGSIRPAEAGQVLLDLSESDDEEIAEAATDAMVMADANSDWVDEEDEDLDEDDDEWVN